MTEKQLREIEERGSFDQNAALNIRALIAEVRKLRIELDTPMHAAGIIAAAQRAGVNSE